MAGSRTLSLLPLLTLLLPLAFACAASAQDDPETTDTEQTPTEQIPDVPPPPEWERSLDFGISGSSGNTVEQDLNFVLLAHRATDRTTADFTLTYLHSTDDKVETDNRLYATGRHTWLFEESKWGVFAQGTADIDKFKAWDQRFSLHGGLSYRVIDLEKTFLETRFGAGAVGTFGDAYDDTTDPEGVLGLSLRHKFTPKLNLIANAEYLPNLMETGEYRFNGSAALEYRFNDSWSIKASVEEVFDSSPDPGDQESDTYYAVRLSWRF